MRNFTNRNCTIDCVFLTCFDSDFQVFASLLHFSGIRIHGADTLEKADFLLTVTDATVLLSDTVFLGGSWTDAGQMLASIHPGVGLVIIVDEDDNELRTEAYDLVSRPLRMSQLYQAIRRAHDGAGPKLAETAWPRTQGL